MDIQKKLYTATEVGQIIVNAVREIVDIMDSKEEIAEEQKSNPIAQWSAEKLPLIESAVAEEVVRRHVQGVTFAVWSGPPGSGKGTNIETVNTLGKVYAEVVSQGGANILPEPFHSRLLDFSVAQATISTGTKGMFHSPSGEYLGLFGELWSYNEEVVTSGGMAMSDGVVSVLVMLMLLRRLTQNAHKVQIDLWPRTAPQFSAFMSLIEKIRAIGGKVNIEMVTIKVVSSEHLEEVRKNPLACAEESVSVSASITDIMKSDWYVNLVKECSGMTSMQERFQKESFGLDKVLSSLAEKHSTKMGEIVVEELRNVCKRMAFRFDIVIKNGGVPRVDEYPLSVVKRLQIYAGGTAPVFLEFASKKQAKDGVFVVTSVGTPEEVVGEILVALIGEDSADKRWQEIKKIAGEIADAVVYKKPLIVEELQRRVGGILNS